MQRQVSWLGLAAAGTLAALVAFFMASCTSMSRDPASKAGAVKSDGLGWASPDDNATTWSQFCQASGGAASTDVPTPNYDNAKVKAAAKKLATVADASFYLYPTIVNAYGLKDGDAPPKGVTKSAHTFFRYLCGEFRDRASLIEAKLDWIANMNKLPNKPQPAVAADSKDNVWMQMTAPSYAVFLQFSSGLWNARAAQITQVKMGSYSENRAVDGLSVCTTKFMLNEISKLGKKTSVPFTNANGEFQLDDFNKAFADYSKDCSDDDIADYYDFRGDSNFKPNTPESNGMIWYATYLASYCKSTSKAGKAPTTTITNDRNVVNDDACADYFKNPFRRRWQAARSGLATWILHDKSSDDIFSNSGSMVVVWPHHITDDPSTQVPFEYKLDNGSGGVSDPLAKWLSGFDPSSDMALADFGFNKLAKTDKGFIFERLRDALNRHTDWYHSGWDDGLGGKFSYRAQAYSPFVASSYEPSSSDQFTHCGITVACDGDGFKQWMFVFRVKGSNRFGTDQVGTKKLDFSSQWFDETSLGTVGLADSEHAWDHLGTAFEDELKGGAILYLHNIKDSGEIVNGDKN